VSLHIHIHQFLVMDSYLCSILALKLNMDPAIGTSLVNANWCLQKWILIDRYKSNRSGSECPLLHSEIQHWAMSGRWTCKTWLHIWKCIHSLTRTAILSLYLAPCRMIALVNTQHWEMLDAGFQVVCCKVLGTSISEQTNDLPQSRSRPIIVLLPQTWESFSLISCSSSAETCFSCLAGPNFLPW